MFQMEKYKDMKNENIKNIDKLFCFKWKTYLWI